MKVTPLNDLNTLFMVEDIYPADLLAECQQQNINTLPWEALGEGVYSQAETPRRMLICNEPSPFAKLDNCIRAHIPIIKEITGKSISNCCTRVWADYPGYTVSKHLDNTDGVYITLQAYLNDGDVELGTHFSNSPTGEYQHAIPYKSNFGYIMVNTDYNFHGMTRPVPANFIRLISYTWFYT
jgi:hypothetical protein